MKRKALALTLILRLVIATLNIYMTGVQAQLIPEPVQSYYEDYEPEITPPEISISSPQNNSVTNANSISLIFSVSAPQAIESVRSQLTQVYYKGDWQAEKQDLYFWDSKSDSYFDFLEFNITLTDIPEGKHELQIMAIGTVNIRVAMFGFTYHSDANASIIFTVNSIQSTPSPEPTSTPTSTPYQEPQQTEQLEIIIGMAIVVTVFAAGLGLLVYLIKRK